jgi:hypothetical protein
MSNWLIGRWVRGDAPRHWVATVEGAAAALQEAAQTLKLDWHHDLQVLTFSVLSCAERFDRCFIDAQHDFERTIETAVDRLRDLCLGRDEAALPLRVPMILHRPEASGPAAGPRAAPSQSHPKEMIACTPPGVG